MASERGQLVGQVVRVVLLVRLASLVAAVGWLVGEKLSPQLFVAIVLLSGFSFVGLTQPAFLDQMIRHPMLAMTDVALVVVVFVVLGVESPLALAALSTSLLIGLLYPPRMAVLLAGVLGLTFAGQALIEAARSADGNQFLPLVGLPVTFCCLVWVGHTVVRSNTAQMHAESRLAELIQASAAADERSRLAREMHDSLAKSLQGLAFGAAALPTWVDQDGDRAHASPAGLRAAPAPARQLPGRLHGGPGWVRRPRSTSPGQAQRPGRPGPP